MEYCLIWENALYGEMLYMENCHIWKNHISENTLYGILPYTEKYHIWKNTLYGILLILENAIYRKSPYWNIPIYGKSLYVWAPATPGS